MLARELAVARPPPGTHGLAITGLNASAAADAARRIGGAEIRRALERFAWLATLEDMGKVALSFNTYWVASMSRRAELLVPFALLSLPHWVLSSSPTLTSTPLSSSRGCGDSTDARAPCRRYEATTGPKWWWGTLGQAFCYGED